MSNKAPSNRRGAGSGKRVRAVKPSPKALIKLSGVADARKVTVGGLIVRNYDSNNAPRKKITIQIKNPQATSKLILRCASNKVRIYDAATGGNQIAIDGTKNVFPKASLPKDLWVEGVNYSDAMRDVEISVDIEGVVGKGDSIKLTVLWVDKPTVALSGTISANNAKRNAYKNWTKAGTYNLGVQLYNANFGERMGWGSEASATVHPTKFSYPGSDLKLERDYYFRDYNDKTLMSQGNYSATIPPGNDTGPAAARDDNPAPNDTIYDWDAAGLLIPSKPANTIHRTRNNFKAFASITVEGKNVRCSEVREYFIRFSQKQAKAPSGNDWKVIDPPDVTGDKQAAHGTTKITWDLK